MLRPSFGQIALGVGVSVATLVLGRKAYALYRASTLLSRDRAPAPFCVPHLATLHGGLRDMSSVRWIVIHATDGGATAEGIGNYFASPIVTVTRPDGSTAKEPGGSTNVVAGDDGCVQSVPDDMIPAGAPPLNERGLHIEFVGQSKWSRNQWFEHKATLENGRRIIRDWSRTYGIPRILRGRTELLDELPGVTTHATITSAWHKTDHLDPGPGFPLDYVLGNGQ